MKYSVIIPSYNSENTIIRCLESITRQHCAEPYEVIVVDSSSDATPTIIRNHFPQVKLFHLEKQTDPGAARNIGIQASRGEVLCLIDSDCIADPDWLHKIAEAHQGRYAAVGGAVLNANPESLVGWAGYLAEFREFFPFHAKQPMRHIASCNISYKRWVFEKYGGFTGTFYPQEDLVYNLALEKNNEAILFDPAIRVSHINKTSRRHFFRHQYRIGRITAMVLRAFPFLTGGFIAQSRLLTVLAWPLLPLVKWGRTLGVVSNSREYRFKFILASPLLLTGLLLWGAGFLKGAFTDLPDHDVKNMRLRDHANLSDIG